MVVNRKNDNMKKSLLLSFWFCLPGMLFSVDMLGQYPDSSLNSKYAPSVIIHINDIARFVTLTTQQQSLLARYYTVRDNIMANWILQHNSQREIDSLGNGDLRELHTVLNNRQFETYVRNRTKDFATAASGNEKAYIREAYGLDSTGETYTTLSHKLFDKYSLLYQHYLFPPNATAEYYIAKSENKTYDNYNFYPPLYAERFINDFLTKISSATPIAKDMRTKIANEAEFFIRMNSNKDLNMVLMQATSHYLPDTAVFSLLYRDELQNKARELSAVDRYDLIKVQKVSVKEYEDIYNIVQTKNYIKALCAITYLPYHKKLFDSAMAQTSIHYDSLIRAKLISDGSLQPTTQFAIALKHKEELGLQPAVIDTLLSLALVTENRRDSIFGRDPYASIDNGPFESEHLTQILSDEQYTRVLFYKNKSLAEANARADWEEMKLRGLSDGLEKEQTIKEIANYYIEVYGSWSRYAHDKIKQWASMHEIDPDKPKSLKMLDTIRWSGSTKKATNNLDLK